jgi:hypothetical protein
MREVIPQWFGPGHHRRLMVLSLVDSGIGELFQPKACFEQAREVVIPRTLHLLGLSRESPEELGIGFGFGVFGALKDEEEKCHGCG